MSDNENERIDTEEQPAAPAVDAEPEPSGDGRDDVKKTRRIPHKAPQKPEKP